VARKKGVTVYQNKDSRYIDLAAEGVVPAPPAAVQRALLAYEKQAGVVPRLAEVKVLARGKQWLRVYQRLSLPVIDDRDFNLRVRWGGDDDKGRWIRYNSTDEGPPPRDGVVRVTHNTGKWLLDGVHGGSRTRLRMISSIDIAGDVPSWMAKSDAGDDIPKLYEAICRLSTGHTGDDSCL
jgi:hypothetical protein